MLFLESVEFSTTAKGYIQILSSIKFNFSDGSSTEEWGQRNFSSFQKFIFQNNGFDVAEIGYEFDEFCILYICFFDSQRRVLVSCGQSTGKQLQFMTIRKDFKIVSAYGASSNYQYQKYVGMIGFDFWYHTRQET